MTRLFFLAALLCGLLFAIPASAQPIAQPDAEANDAPAMFFSAGGDWEWLQVQGVDYAESVSRPGAYGLRGTSAEARDPSDLVGLRATIGILGSNGTYSYLHGFVEEAGYSRREFQGQVEHSYNIRVVSWLRLLSHTSTCEIFENLSMPQILRRVVDRHPFSDVEFRLARRYPRREREVQYRETDLNFVQRILEHEGLYYFFEHTSAGHKMIITDAETRPRGNVRLLTTGDGPNRIQDLRRQVRIRPNSYALADVARDGTIQSAAANEPPRAGLDLAIFDYPGEYSSSRDAEHAANLRLDELRSRAGSLTGRVSDSQIHAGQGVRIDGRSFLVTEANRSESVHGDGGDVHFTAVPRSQIYRPSRVTPKPMVMGMQTASVIAVENSTRIRVRFPWERDGAGVSIGTWVSAPRSEIPLRVGTRVLMAFDEGDPNRPIAVQALGVVGE